MGATELRRMSPKESGLVTMDGEHLEAISYILPRGVVSGSNSAYAIELATTAKKLDLPHCYIGEIEGWI